MKILVTGGTGTVGSEVVRQLLPRGAEVSVLTRNAGRAGALPAGVRPVIGDLLDPGTIRAAFQGMDALFLLNVVSPTETHEGLMALNGAILGGVKRVVYLSVHEVEKASYLPHFGSKVPVEHALRHSGLEWTILRPNNFHQNDYWYRDAMLQYGVYPQPLGDVGVSRVDVRDIGEAAAIALTTDGHGGRIYNLVGPDLCTGAGTAAIWSRHLGRPVAYGGNDLDAWEQQAGQYLPAILAFDFRLMYGHFQRHGLKATPQDIEAQTALLGHPPRSFEEFARETAAAWKS